MSDSLANSRFDHIGEQTDLTCIDDAMLARSGSVRLSQARSLPLAFQSKLPPSNITKPIDVPWPPPQRRLTLRTDHRINGRQPSGPVSASFSIFRIHIPFSVT